jgi:hypothetical protein
MSSIYATLPSSNLSFLIHFLSFFFFEKWQEKKGNGGNMKTFFCSLFFSTPTRRLSCAFLHFKFSLRKNLLSVLLILSTWHEKTTKNVYQDYPLQDS